MQNYFDNLAVKWDSNPMRVKNAFEFVDGTTSRIDKDISNFNILDYGCGSGLVSFGFKDKVKSIKGMDSSSGMLERFNQKAKDLNFNNISSLQHNINEEDLEANIFDLVVTNMTMHHIKDMNIFISKLINSTKQNGYVCIADLESEDGTFHSDNSGVEHFGFKKQDVYNAFTNLGLKCVKVETLHTIIKEDRSYPIFIAIGEKQ